MHDWSLLVCFSIRVFEFVLPSLEGKFVLFSWNWEKEEEEEKKEKKKEKEEDMADMEDIGAMEEEREFHLLKDSHDDMICNIVYLCIFLPNVVLAQFEFEHGWYQ